jgi:sirohydrochlorin ferrochelatase
MTHDALLLIGRQTTHAHDVLETHARRLRRRNIAQEVRTATYGSEPVRELRDTFEGVDADRAFALPFFPAHSHETTADLPAALSYLPGDARYCEPLGHSPAITDAILARAGDELGPGADATLILVGFGSSSQPYHRQVAEYHASRVRESSAYAAVNTCYLLQNPTVECARYNVDTERAVAVPLFAARSKATDSEIPSKLELDRGGIRYADPLGGHPLVTDAIEAEVAKQRVLADREDAPESFEASLARSNQPVATDGEGPI